MYFSGVIVAFTLAFIVLMIQHAHRKRNKGESFLYGLTGSIFGAAFISIFSWIGAILIVLAFFLWIENSR